MSLNPAEPENDTADSLAEQIRWALLLPERIRLLIHEGRREDAERDVDRLKAMLKNWDNVKGTQDLLNQCKAALAFGEQ